jgi:hypothetical protein
MGHMEKIICSVCNKGTVYPSKKKSNDPNIVHLRCMRPACQAKFNKEISAKTFILRRVA